MHNSSTACVDASLVVRRVLEPSNEPVQQLWQQWTVEDRWLVAPTLLHYEVTNALHRLRRHGQLPSEIAERALATVLMLPLHLHDDDDLHRSALAFAARYSLSATYDAHYLALADRFKTDLWTADRRLVNAVRPHLRWVHLVGE